MAHVFTSVGTALGEFLAVGSVSAQPPWAGPPGGVPNPVAVAAKIREHVRAMEARLRKGRPIHRRDPLFAALFAHAKHIRMQVEETANGVRVHETSADPYATKLIRAHAAVVSRFLAEGWDEVQRNHEVPPR